MQAYTVLRECDFSLDPFSLFCELAKDVSNAVLLESKDGNGKNNVNSMLFVENAVCIEGRGSRVVLKPLTPNGTRALSAMEQTLDQMAVCVQTDEGLELTFSGSRPSGDDISRIKGAYPADVLRIFSRNWNLGTDEKSRRISLPGVFSYDHLDHLEVLPDAAADSHEFADFVFYLPEVAVIVDHEKSQAKVLVHGYNATSYDDQFSKDKIRAEELAARIGNLREGTSYSAVGTNARKISRDVAVDLCDEEYCDLVKKLKEHIVCGDVFQIVPSRTFSAPCDDTVATYGVLRSLNPSPYLFYVRHSDFTLLGSSPETSVRVVGDPLKTSIHPIAGTRRRGYHSDGTLDTDLDSRLEAELKLNKKEVAEHMMLVDLARNDIARISRPGTRQVVQLLEVERYSHVMHLVSVVEGELRPDLDALHAYMASSNMGTLVGAPKIEAAKLLRLHEADKRGPYGGAVGYLTSDGEMDTAIIIRAALIRKGMAYVRAGAGVVYDSEPMAEADETRAKASAVLRAIELAKEVSK